MRTPAAARRRNAKDSRPFPVCPRAGAPQIWGVRRFAPIAAIVFAAAATLPAAGDPMAKFSAVTIDPASANLYIATVSMTFHPFVRHNAEYSSTYVARVFPFFYTEKGRISIVVPDDLLHRVDRGEPVDFVGRALERLRRHAEGRGPRGSDRPADREDPGARVHLTEALPQLRHHLRAYGRRGAAPPRITAR